MTQQMEGRSSARLVELFIDIALEQDQAIFWGRNNRYNDLYREMAKVELELKKRAGDERRLLIPLYKHDNPLVRLKAAIATLAIEPMAARAILQSLSDDGKQPYAADAIGMIWAMDEGRYTPT